MKIVRYTVLTLLSLFALQQSALAQCVRGAPCVTGDYTVGNNQNNFRTGGANGTCDGDFMNQIYARAFMEAQRDVMMAQTYIRKPDSTLEYTCFDRMINHAARNAPPLFSENNDWFFRIVPLNIAFLLAANPPFIFTVVSMGTGHILPSLQNVVSDPMQEHLQNYNHNFLGGTGGMNSSIANSVSRSSYSCASMDAIWMIARCQNFPNGPSLFLSFEDLAAADPRQFPTPGSCTSPISTQLIDTSRNAAPAFDTAEFDRLEIYSDLILPATNNAECLTPIATGTESVIYEFTSGAVTTANPSGVTRRSITYDEMICRNPGCYFSFTPNFNTGTITGRRCIKG